MSTTRDRVGERKKIQEKPGESFGQPLDTGHPPEQLTHRGSWSPPVDLYETHERIVLRVDLPGISIDQIELRIENERLILRGERSMDFSSRREDFRLIERPHGSFFRTFALPRSIRQAEIRAEMINGVLEVVLPKHAEARSRPIKVEVR
jgi:HSP20 family protein